MELKDQKDFKTKVKIEPGKSRFLSPKKEFNADYTTVKPKQREKDYKKSRLFTYKKYPVKTEPTKPGISSLKFKPRKIFDRDDEISLNVHAKLWEWINALSPMVMKGKPVTTYRSHMKLEHFLGKMGTPLNIQNAISDAYFLVKNRCEHNSLYRILMNEYLNTQMFILVFFSLRRMDMIWSTKLINNLRLQFLKYDFYDKIHGSSLM